MSNAVEVYITALVTLKATKQAFAALLKCVDDQRATLAKWESGQKLNLDDWPSLQGIETKLAAFQRAFNEANAAWGSLTGSAQQAVLPAPSEIVVDPTEELIRHSG